MKLFTTLLGALLWCTGVSAPAAVIISNITTSPVISGTLTTNATLLTLTSSGTTYTSLSAPAAVTGVAGASEYIWGTSASNPGSVAAAVSDLNIATGSLNTGTGAIYGFNSVTASTVFFAFGNYGADQPGSVVLVNSSGVNITSGLTLPSTTAANDLLTETANRSAGGAALTRTIRGYTFGVTEFTFLGGATAADVAGFKINGSGYDVQDVGIAAVPEPATALLFGLSALGFLSVRRGAIRFARR